MGGTVVSSALKFTTDLNMRIGPSKEPEGMPALIQWTSEDQLLTVTFIDLPVRNDMITESRDSMLESLYSNLICHIYLTILCIMMLRTSKVDQKSILFVIPLEMINNHLVDQRPKELFNILN